MEVKDSYVSIFDNKNFYIRMIESLDIDHLLQLKTSSLLKLANILGLSKKEMLDFIQLVIENIEHIEEDDDDELNLFDLSHNRHSTDFGKISIDKLKLGSQSNQCYLGFPSIYKINKLHGTSTKMIDKIKFTVKNSIFHNKCIIII